MYGVDIRYRYMMRGETKYIQTIRGNRATCTPAPAEHKIDNSFGTAVLFFARFAPPPLPPLPPPIGPRQIPSKPESHP